MISGLATAAPTLATLPSEQLDTLPLVRESGILTHNTSNQAKCSPVGRLASYPSGRWFKFDGGCLNLEDRRRLSKSDVDAQTARTRQHIGPTLTAVTLVKSSSMKFRRSSPGWIICPTGSGKPYCAGPGFLGDSAAHGRTLVSCEELCTMWLRISDAATLLGCRNKSCKVQVQTLL